VGGQFGLEFAIDAPWRIEPVPGTGGKLSYGPIPIVIVFHDAIFEDNRPSLAKWAGFEKIRVGELVEIRVRERITEGPDTQNQETTDFPLSQLRELERKRWISTVDAEPVHEVCRPYEETDCRPLHLITGSHEWHALFWYSPRTPVTPGRNIHLDVSVITKHGSDLKEWRNYLVVHAGEAPLPRFSANWLYGDLHYHSQMTDNEGESAYSYRNVVRTLGAIGLDFVFATDHASGGTQVDGETTVPRCGSPSGASCDPRITGPQQSCRSVCKFFKGTEARDLNGARFKAAKEILYGRGGANELIARDVDLGGVARYQTDRIVPQVYMGEELDAWPAISEREHRDGEFLYGDGLRYKWADVDGCIGRRGLLACRKTYSNLMPSENEHRALLVLDEQGIPTEETVSDLLAAEWRSIAKFVVPDGTAPHPSRQHVVYFPFDSAPTGQGWVPGATKKFGGASQRLPDLLKTIQGKGVAFLAHPLVGDRPRGPGPDIVPYSNTALTNAWRSPAVLGLQFWNEDNRYFSSPTRRQPTVIGRIESDGVDRYLYQLPWADDAPIGNLPYRWQNRVVPSNTSNLLYHGGFTWDRYLRSGLDPAQTKQLTWLPARQPRKWFVAGGSDGHGDFNFRREGRPCLDRWCDAPVTDTAIGKPRNLVFAGVPAGDRIPARPRAKRYSNRQVIQALRDGHFSVTDGPAQSIAIDRNRNGVIDDADFHMGSTFHLHPGEHVPLLVEWISTPEFGRVKRVDVYVGNKERTFAPEDPGPQHTSESQGAYARDPSGVLRIKLDSEEKEVGYGGIARLFLSPKQFDLTFNNAPLFYVRAYAETVSRTENDSECPAPSTAPGSCGDRSAFTNPVWGVYVHDCKADGIAIDSDRNRIPDTCERPLPDPCAAADDAQGPRGGTPEAAPPGTSATAPTAQPPQGFRPPPAASCSIVQRRTP